MAIDFPASPAVGQRYAFNGVNYVFTAQGVWSVVNTGLPATSTSKVTVQKFTANGTYTPTPGTQFAIVECVGGGGGGGGIIGQASLAYSCGGGGSGGYSRSVLTAAQIGLSQPVTIGAGGTPGPGLTNGGAGGAGGDTAFGALCIAKGARAQTGWSDGGLGGAVGTGDFTAAGAPGQGGTVIPNGYYAMSGGGGNSFFGGGGQPAIEPSSGNYTFGNSGSNYGGGGSGAAISNSGAGPIGGAGSPGVCIITEYNIAAAGPQGPTGPMGGTTGVSAPGGRLTLDAAKPVMNVTVAGAGTIYYVPYIGDRIPIYDGGQMIMTTIPAGLSCTTTDTVKNPSVIAPNKNNDWFVWLDGGTVRLCHGPDWQNDTQRSAGTGITAVNGIYINNAQITNACAPGRGTYVGTTRSDVNGNLSFIFGSRAAGGGPGFIGVWNAYNRVNIAMTVQDTTASWSYNSSAVALYNGSPGWRVSFVTGLEEDTVTARIDGFVVHSAAGFAYSLITFDGAMIGGALLAQYPYWSVVEQIVSVAGPSFGAATGSFIGFHYASAVQVTTSGAVTYLGTGNSAMIFNWRC